MSRLTISRERLERTNSVRSHRQAEPGRARSLVRSAYASGVYQKPTISGNAWRLLGYDAKLAGHVTLSGLTMRGVLWHVTSEGSRLAG